MSTPMNQTSWNSREINMLDRIAIKDSLKHTIPRIYKNTAAAIPFRQHIKGNQCHLHVEQPPEDILAVRHVALLSY